MQMAEDECDQIREGIKRLDRQMQIAQTEFHDGINKLKSGIQEGREKIDRDLKAQVEQVRSDLRRQAELFDQRFDQRVKQISKVPQKSESS